MSVSHSAEQLGFWFVPQLSQVWHLSGEDSWRRFQRYKTTTRNNLKVSKINNDDNDGHSVNATVACFSSQSFGHTFHSASHKFSFWGHSCDLTYLQNSCLQSRGERGWVKVKLVATRSFLSPYTSPVLTRRRETTLCERSCVRAALIGQSWIKRDFWLDLLLVSKNMQSAKSQVRFSGIDRTVLCQWPLLGKGSFVGAKFHNNVVFWVCVGFFSWK